MSLKPISATDAVAVLGEFDRIIDVRSPAEFALDHLPGAVNWPVLDNDERARVGTMYVQESVLKARQIGAAIVARHIAEHLAREAGDLPREWRPLVYCWRGGQRSGSMAWILSEIGFRTVQLQGGYKAFRALVREDLPRQVERLRFVVLCGRTGTGKTRLLHTLAAEGAQVLDLEGLACHRGSVLGALPGTPQPSQKGFDTALWQALRGFDAARPVFVESESQRIGVLQVPRELLDRMHAHGQPVHLQMPVPARLDLLMQDYAAFFADPEGFAALLDPLVPLRSRTVVKAWQDAARAGDWRSAFEAMLVQHYDPLYDKSLERSYGEAGTAGSLLDLPDGLDATLHDAARRLIADAA